MAAFLGARRSSLLIIWQGKSRFFAWNLLHEALGGNSGYRMIGATGRLRGRFV